MLRNLPVHILRTRSCCNKLQATCLATVSSNLLKTTSLTNNGGAVTPLFAIKRLQSTSPSSSSSQSTLTENLEHQKSEDLEKVEESQNTPTSSSQVESSSSSVPWYLRDTNEDLDQQNPSLKEPIPELPSNPSDSLGPLVEFLVRDLGLVDVSFLDLRDREPVTIFGPDAIMVVATGKNDRHIGKATQELLTWIKHNYGIVPYKEGVHTAGFIKVQKRRQKKKSKKLALADDSYESLESRFTSNWVTMDTKLDSLIVHLFTEDKRKQIDLEYVWAKNKRELREQRRKLQEEQDKLAEQEYHNLHEQHTSQGDSITSEVWGATTKHQQQQQQQPSPFGSSFGSIRKFHTSRSVKVTPAPPSPAQSYPSIYSELMTSSSKKPQSQTRPLAKEKGPSIEEIYNKLQLVSFLGNYKEALRIYRESFAQLRPQDKFNDLLNPKTAVAVQQDENTKDTTKPNNETLEINGEQALLTLLKAHINYLSKIKSNSMQAKNEGTSSSSSSSVDTTKDTQNTTTIPHSISTDPTTTYSNLKQNSDVVNSFIGSFPYFPTHDHWKLRLVFFQRAHMINPKEFPLKMLLEIAVMQQASGECVDYWDVDFIINSIIHSTQFDGHPFMRISHLKSKLVFSLLTSCVRPLPPGGRTRTGVSKTPNVDDNILMLIYRLYINDKNKDRKYTVTASSAALDPTPYLDKNGDVFAVATQSKENGKSRVITPIARHLYNYFSSEIKEFDKHPLTKNNPKLARSFLILSLTAFANDGLWSSYWSLWKKITHSSFLDSELLYVMSALVSKSGDRKAMSFLVDHAIPKLLLDENKEYYYITPKMESLITGVLRVLDPDELGYRNLRRSLLKSRTMDN